MPACFIAEIKVHDPEPYAEYVAQVPALVAKYGGRYVVRGGAAEVVMGDWDPGRIIVIEFDSAERVREWLSSPEYRAVAPLREQSTESRAIVVEGCEHPAIAPAAAAGAVPFDLTPVQTPPTARGVPGGGSRTMYVALGQVSWALYIVGILIIALSYLRVVSPGIGWSGWLIGMVGWVLSLVARGRWR